MDKQAVLAVLVALLATTVAGVAAYRAGLQTVEQAPDFALTSTGYENGTMGEPVAFRLSDYRNRTVLLDFMAVTCTSCRIVTDQVLRPIHAEFGNRSDFVILSIDTWADPASGQTSWPGETREELVRLQQDEGVPWRHALDTDEVYLKYQAKSLPKLVVVGPEGQIVKEWGIGGPPLGDVRAAVLAGLAGNAPAGTVWRAPPGFVIGATALLAGVASFFAPCSVGLVPAYMGVLLRAAKDQTPAARAVMTLRAGLSTGLGMVLVYAVIAAVLWLLEMAGHGPAIRAALPRLSPVMAVLLIVLGALMFFQVGWQWIERRMGNRIDARQGFMSFGAAYGVAAFGCTGPIFLPVLLNGFSQGAATGLLALGLYAGAVAALLLLAAALVAGGHVSRLRGMLSHTLAISRTSAVLLVAAGLILLWTDWRAGVI